MSTTNTTPTSNAAAIAARLNGTKRGNGWRAVCPAHDDNNPSLSIMEGQDGRTLLHCFAGCTVEAVVKAAGLTMGDLAPTGSSTPRRIVKTYDYVDATGNLVFQVVRFEPKDFRQRRPDPKNPGSWIWNLQGVTRVLYRLPDVLNANADGATVFCTEGERDADALVALGLCATCNAGGAGKWQVGYTSALTGANVVVIADKDAPGRSHAAMVLEALTGKATSVRVLELPDRDGHPVKDAADWIAAGGTAAELQALVETALEWQPPAAAEAPAPAPEQSELELRYGPTHNTRPGKKGVPTFDGLNEPYWAGLHAHRHTELFEPMEKTFYRYDPDTGLYTPVTSDTIKTEVGDMLLEHGRSGCDFGDAFIAERTDRQQGAIVNQLRGIVEKRDAFTKRPQAIHLANGMIVFTDGVPNLVSFSPKFRSRNQSPIAYDPAATCPRFLGELVDPAVHAEDVAVIQKYMGLCLLGRNLIQRFMILDGKEGRGKTQLANVFQFIVGQVNASQLRTEHLADRFEVYRFLRKTLLVGVDVPANFLGSKGAFVIKGLVGGDFFDAERKGSSDCFPVAGEFCVVITSNTRLRVKLEGDVGAWRRRMLIVRYEAPSPAKKIPDFGKVLVDAEGPGILNWALQGLDALIKDVSETGDIRLTQRQKDSVISLLSESDSLRVFLEEKVTCEIGNDLTVSEIVQAYAEFCPTRGWNPMSITVVERDLPGLMLELFHVVKVHSISRIGSPQQRGFNHVRFK